MSKSDHARQPKQARSRRTRQRILEAAQELIAERGVEGASVPEIASRAGASVGNFYLRFASKAALLRAVEEQLLEGRMEAWDDLLQPERWGGEPLSAIVERVIREIATRHRQNRDLLRAIAAHARSEYGERIAARHEEVVERLTDLSLARKAEIAHESPAFAIKFALRVVTAAIEDFVLFGEGYEPGSPRSDEEMIAELSAVFLGYLGTGRAPA